MTNPDFIKELELLKRDIDSIATHLSTQTNLVNPSLLIIRCCHRVAIQMQCSMETLKTRILKDEKEKPEVK